MLTYFIPILTITTICDIFTVNDAFFTELYRSIISLEKLSKMSFLIPTISIDYALDCLRSPMPCLREKNLSFNINYIIYIIKTYGLYIPSVLLK
jgi:hypothetical protein